MRDRGLLPQEALEEARQYCLDEYIDYMIYKELAEAEKNTQLKKILEELSEQEYRHYQFWKGLAGECAAQIPRMKIRIYKAMRRILGLTFTLKYLEMHEKEVIENYKRFRQYLQGKDLKELEAIINDEVHHENSLMAQLNEGIVKYLSFIALGLADAIVEISGVHAGFLGATKETLIAGIAGLIVGVSAAFSMSGAAYLQAKAEAEIERSDPGKSAIVTGVSYMVAVVILALPYFLTQHQLTAFIISIILAVILIAGFTYYNAVLNEKEFTPELIENSAILFGTAAIAYIFGGLLGSIFGLEGIL